MSRGNAEDSAISKRPGHSVALVREVELRTLAGGEVDQLLRPEFGLQAGECARNGISGYLRPSDLLRARAVSLLQPMTT